MSCDVIFKEYCSFSEFQLRKQYEISNQAGITNYNEIRSIKVEIDSHRHKIAIGVKVRSRVQDSLSEECISKYLIAKQKEIAQKKIIHTMTDDNGVHLTSFCDIQNHITRFYKNLYYKNNCDMEKQEYFLAFLTNELADSDRLFLSSPLSTS